jgi:hypothetical protein
MMRFDVLARIPSNLRRLFDALRGLTSGRSYLRQERILCGCKGNGVLTKGFNACKRLFDRLTVLMITS